MNWLIPILGGTGVIVSGFLSFFGARRGSKDLIKAQTTNQAAQLAAQQRQFELARMHVFADKQADAYQGMIGTLTRRPRLKEVTGERAIIGSFLKALQEWHDELTAAQVPLYTYADRVIFERAQRFLDDLHQHMLTIADEVSTIIWEHENTYNGAPDEDGEVSEAIFETGSRYIQLISVDTASLLNILREAVQAAPLQFFTQPDTVSNRLPAKSEPKT